MFDSIKTIYKKDPSLRGVGVIEIILYQGLYAILFHRVSHFLYRIKIPFIPRFISQISRFLTGIEIHPGAKIGKRCFIDHGMGIVIGETAIIGNDVMMYDNVLLGAKGWWLDNRGSKRHPTIGDNVTLGSGCKIIGSISIGDNSIISAGAIITKNIPADVIAIQKNELFEKALNL